MKNFNRNAALVIIGFWVTLFIIGYPEPEPRERPEWGPAPEMSRVGSSNRVKKTTRTRPRMTFGDPWKEDARRNTAKWQEFLEDLDEEGIMLSDPDAIEIWERDYE
jgi:hypothetical protein